MAHTKPVLRALLVTDLVDSTWLVEQLGDLRAAELFARHDRLARDLLLAWKGLEIDRTDGFLFLFDRALDAVRYALHYQRSLSELAREVGSPLQARVGIHVGEVLLRENSVEDVARGAKPLEVEGLAKPICARLAALARGGQVLLSRTAYDLAHRSALDDTLEGRVSWMEHGTYMLKGVADPVEVVEVGEAGLAPLIAPQASDKARAMRALTNLPQAQTSFVGRSADLAALRSLLPSHRLLTLTGSGGCGKTRLAHHFGAELLRGDGDGVWLVDLAGQQEPSLVVAAVAAVFRVVEAPGRPLLQSLLEHLRDRYLLLILDNCEHLLDAVARLAEAILRQCPQVWLLVTSREALGIAGEQTWRVQPLPVPDPRHLQLAALAEVDSFGPASP
jgi:class 3 adenylate cyclase